MKHHESVVFNHKAGQLVNDRVNTSSYGLCSTCDYFNYQRTAYKNIRCWCSYWIEVLGAPSPSAVRPNNVDPVANCTNYRDKHSMDIHEMRQIAWHIDVKKTRVATGFRIDKTEDKVKEGEETIITVQRPGEREDTDE